MAATQLILEVGGEPPLDAVARRADVGIATLYRHFPDRAQLLHAVAQRALDRSVDAARTALSETSDGYEALCRYMHAAVELGVGVLNLVHPLLGDPDWTGHRARIAPLLTAMLEQGTAGGRLRDRMTPADVVFAVIRFSRPVALGLAPEVERAWAHRHLDIYLAGLERCPDEGPLPVPPPMDRGEAG